jgi:hypothetical protein
MGASTSAGTASLIRRLRPVALGISEVVLFAFSLAIAIPPVPSDAGDVYPVTSAMWMGGLAFAGFLVLSRRKPWVAVCLLPVYLVFAWEFTRVFLSNVVAGFAPAPDGSMR